MWTPAKKKLYIDSKIVLFISKLSRISLFVLSFPIF